MDERFRKILSGSEPATFDELSQFAESYPYFTVPAICALRDKVPMTSVQRTEIISRLAISSPDRAAVSDLIDDDAMQFLNFYPEEEENGMTTNDTIDTFLNTFGKADSREVDALTKMIFNPTPDYASVLAAEEQRSVPTSSDLDEQNVDEQDLRINRFIAEKKQVGVTIPVSHTSEDVIESAKEKSDKLTNSEPIKVLPPQEVENSSLTESFAKVMIKNRNYSKALEIITNLSLNNPEKSIYFADQIRFLQKLIINEHKQ